MNRRQFLQRSLLATPSCADSGGILSDVTPPLSWLPGWAELFGQRPGADIATLRLGTLRSVATSVVRIVWDRGGNRGASGVVVGGHWLLTVGHVIRDAKRWSDVVVVSHFESSAPTDHRKLYTCDVNAGYFVSTNKAELNYVMIRLVPFDSAGFVNEVPSFGMIKGAMLPMPEASTVESILNGHPESGYSCASISRKWASKTFKNSLVRRGSRPNELDLSTATCGGHSGSAIFDNVGRLLGIHNAELSDKDNFRAFSLEAIRADLLKQNAPSIVGITDALEMSTSTSAVTWTTPEKFEAGGPGTPRRWQSIPYVAPFGSDALSSIALSSIALSSICYIYWIDYDGGTISFSDCATGFLIGKHWLLTARHVLPSPLSAKMARLVFGYGPLRPPFDCKSEGFNAPELKKLVDSGRVAQLDECQYFASLDGAASYTGQERDLDYALVRISSSHESVEMRRPALATFATPRPGQICHIAQHRPRTPSGFWRRVECKPQSGGPMLPEEYPTRICSVDEHKLYYTPGSTIGGASGSPIFNDVGVVMGMHTNPPRDPPYPAPRSWEGRALAAADEFAFGTRISAIAADLVRTHKLKLSMIDGFRDAWVSSKELHGHGANNI